MAILNFALDTEKDSKDFSGEFQVATPGWKTGVILSADIQQTKKGGQMLVIKNEITGGEENGIQVIDRLNIVNASDVAQRIGRAALAKIALCIGHRGQLTNTDVLCGKPYQFKVKIEEFKSNKQQADGTYATLKSNKITDYREAKTAMTQAAKPAMSTASTSDWG